MDTDQLQNVANALTAEAIDQTRQRDRLNLVRIFMLVSIVAIFASLIIALFNLNNPFVILITLASGSVYVVMFKLLTIERMRVLCIIMGISAGGGLLVGLHQSGGFAGPTSVLMVTMLITLMVLYEGRDFLYACVILLLAYIGIAILEASGIMPPVQNASPDGVRFTTAAYTIISLLMGGAFLFWYLTRYSNTTRNAVVQARQLAALNQQMINQQQFQSQAASNVLAATQRIDTAIEIQARSAQEQAATVAQVSSSAEQLGLEAQLIAGSANAVSELAGQAKVEVDATRQLIDELDRAMRLVHTDVSLAVERTAQLSEHTREVVTLLQLLESISKETHILSLNAAIEAASAEDTNLGRRFTVVAHEVEELAARADRATNQARTIITQIEQASNSTALATIESMSETERSVEVLQQATAAAQKLSAMAADVNIWADSILQSTEQQRISSEQVAIALRQISGIAQQNVSSEHQLQSVAEQLTALVAHLQQATPPAPDDPSPHSVAGGGNDGQDLLIPSLVPHPAP